MSNTDEDSPSKTGNAEAGAGAVPGREPGPSPGMASDQLAALLAGSGVGHDKSVRINSRSL